MRILILHSRYASGAISGENRVVEDEARLLEEGGHDVLLWTPAADGLHGVQAAAAGIGAVWSTRANNAVRSLVSSFRPDVVHCHNLFPLLSPAVLRTLPPRIPLAVTLHNYRLLCLPATFVRNGATCEACLGRLPWRGVVHRCYRRSAPASAALATSLALHRAIRSFERVSLFLAVSSFVRDKHIEAGLPPGQIHVKPNFVWPAERRRGPGEFFLFLGRLSREKAIGALVEAWREIPAPLVLAGDGPARSELDPLPANVELLGPLPPAEVPRLLSSARALLFPTLAYEGAPRAILESFAAGVPVVASAIGAVPELVEDGASGVLLPSLSGASVSAAVERLLDDAEAERMGEAAWRAWRDRFSPESGLDRLEQTYRSLIERQAA